MNWLIAVAALGKGVAVYHLAEGDDLPILVTPAMYYARKAVIETLYSGTTDWNTVK